MAGTDTKQLLIKVDAATELARRNLGELERSVAANAAKMDASLSRIDGASDRLGRTFGSLKAAAEGFLASISVGALVSVAKSGLDYASSLGEVAQQLGITTRDLQVYRYAASQVGISQEEMDKSLAKLTVNIGKAAEGSKAQAARFGQLGVSVQDASGRILTAGEVVPKLADALEKIKDPAARAAIEVDLFGKTGQKLDTLLSGGSAAINQLTSAAERLGLVLSPEMIQRADDAADKLSAVKQVLEANIAGIVAQNADAILIMANALGTAATNAGQATIALRNFLSLRAFDKGDAAAGVFLAGSQSGRDALLNNINAKLERNQKDRAAGRGNRTSILGGLIETTSTATAADNARLDAEYRALVRQRNAVLKIEVNASKSLALPKPIALPGLPSGTPRAPSGSASRSSPTRSTTPDYGPDLRNLDPSPGLGINTLPDLGDISTLKGDLADMVELSHNVSLEALLPTETQQRLEQFAAGFTDDLSRGLGYAITQGGSLGDVLVQSLQRAAAEALSSGFAKLLGGGISSAVGSIGNGGIGQFFSGLHFAAGGAPPVGLASLVGERGPELFIPKVPGTIIPNHALGGGQRILSMSITVSGVENKAEMTRIAYQAANEGAQHAITTSRDDLRLLMRPGL